MRDAHATPELSPGEFVDLVRTAVEEDSARVVVIDSLNGYLNAMPKERFLSAQLHELLTYLGIRGITTLMVVTQHGIVGSTIVSGRVGWQARRQEVRTRWVLPLQLADDAFGICNRLNLIPRLV